MEEPVNSRRGFLRHPLTLAAAACLAPVGEVLRERGWLGAASAATVDFVHDTLNGLIAFVVPGPDAYSVGQGVSTAEPGGLDANVTDVLIQTLDLAQPEQPNPPSVQVAVLLNQVSQAMFGKPFSGLLFAQKVAVFGYLESQPALAPLVALLFLFASYLSYSEAGVLDPSARRLTGWPVGWTISGYAGVSRGHDEFLGYYQNRRKAERRP